MDYSDQMKSKRETPGFILYFKGWLVYVDVHRGLWLFPSPGQQLTHKRRARSHSFKIFHGRNNKTLVANHKMAEIEFQCTEQEQAIQAAQQDITHQQAVLYNSFVHGFPCYNIVQKKVLKIPGAHVAGNSEHRTAFFPAPCPQECLCLSIDLLSVFLSGFLSIFLSAFLSVLFAFSLFLL